MAKKINRKVMVRFSIKQMEELIRFIKERYNIVIPVWEPIITLNDIDCDQNI